MGSPAAREDAIRSLTDLIGRGTSGTAIDQLLAGLAAAEREGILAEARRRAKLAGHEGALEEEVSDTRGPGPGYDEEPQGVTNRSGVIT